MGDGHACHMLYGRSVVAMVPVLPAAEDSILSMTSPTAAFFSRREDTFTMPAQSHNARDSVAN